MNNKKDMKKAIDFQEYLKEQLKDKKIKKFYEEYGKQLANSKKRYGTKGRIAKIY